MICIVKKYNKKVNFFYNFVSCFKDKIANYVCFQMCRLEELLRQGADSALCDSDILITHIPIFIRLLRPCWIILS